MRKISVYKILMYALWISLFRIYAIPKIIQQVFKIAFILLVILYIVKHIKDKKYYFNYVSSFCLCVIISTFLGYINSYIKYELFIDSILYSACLFCTNAMIKFGLENNKKNVIINSLYNVLFIYLLFSIISIIKIGGSDSTVLLQYFAGNKFTTSYYIMLFNIIFAVKYEIPKKNKIKFIILTILTVFLCAYIKCSTTVVASIFLFLCIIKSRRIKKLLVKNKILIISLVISFISMLFINFILENKYVLYMITNVLNENITLTGRINIYENLWSIILKNPIFGYGYGNEIIQSVVGYGNAQNAVYQIIIQYGFLGLASFLLMFNNSITNNNSDEKLDIWPMYVYIYVIIICSIAEISFNYTFFTVLFFIRSYNLIHKESVVKVSKKENEINWF